MVYINKRTFLDQKWGTREPVVFRDAELGMVRLRAFGNYAYRIADSQLFINTVVGSQGLFETDRLKDFYRDVIVSRLNDLLGETLKTIFDLPRYYDELGTAAKARLAEDFAKYGVDLTDFYVNSITPPDEVQEKIDERSAMGAVGDMNTYMQFKAAQAIQDAAQGGGGEGGSEAGAGMGLGLGAGFGAMMPGMIAGAMQQAQQGGAAPAAAAGGGALPRPSRAGSAPTVERGCRRGRSSARAAAPSRRRAAARGAASRFPRAPSSARPAGPSKRGSGCRSAAPSAAPPSPSRRRNGCWCARSATPPWWWTVRPPSSTR